MFTTMTTEPSPGYIVTEEAEIITYDDLIEDQDAAIAELLQSDIDGLGPFGSKEHSDA